MKRRAFLIGSLAVAAFAYEHPNGSTSQAATAVHQTGTVAEIIAYAAAQTGKPYLWAATGPDSFDCSGLVMEAYAHAGIQIPRTSQEQWAAGPQVSTPLPGDLVFFAGADGTPSQPGHVGLVTGPNRMIEAYAPGTPIGTYPYGVPSALEGTGPGTVVGYTRPWA